MAFCSKCGKKLNEKGEVLPQVRAPVGERGGSGTSISQSGGGSSGTFSWDQAGQMRDLSREFQESDVEQNKLMAVLFVFLAPGAAANPVREGLKVRQISCKTRDLCYCLCRWDGSLYLQC